MPLDPEELKRIDPLLLSNTISLSALVALLVRKGVLQEAELLEEIRRLRESLTRGAPPPGP